MSCPTMPPPEESVFTNISIVRPVFEKADKGNALAQQFVLA